MRLINYSAIVLLLSFANTANAGQGIPSPYVKNGQRKIFTDGFYRISDGNNKFRERLTFDYAVDDKLQLRTRATYEDDRKDSFNFNSLELSGKYELTEKNEWLIDAGIYAGVILRDSNKDAYVARLLLAKTYDQWQHRGNIILTNNFGEELNKAKLELRYKASHKLNDNLSLACEYYGTFCTLGRLAGLHNSAQRLGPVLSYQFQDEPIQIEFGILAGLNEQTESTMLKWRLGYNF